MASSISPLRLAKAQWRVIVLRKKIEALNLKVNELHLNLLNWENKFGGRFNQLAVIHEETEEDSDAEGSTSATMEIVANFSSFNESLAFIENETLRKKRELVFAQQSFQVSIEQFFRLRAIARRLQRTTYPSADE